MMRGMSSSRRRRYVKLLTPEPSRAGKGTPTVKMRPLLPHTLGSKEGNDLLPHEGWLPPSLFLSFFFFFFSLGAVMSVAEM